MNLTPYLHLRDGNDLEPMDERHVQMIHAVLVGETPTSVVNIGVANGFSSMASVEAAESRNVIGNVGFVDVNLRECFRKMVAHSSALGRFRFHEMNSETLYEPYECWIIDGDHKEGAVKDYENARKCIASMIIAHDTAPTWAPDVQWGAIEIGKRMRESCVAYFEDWADRKGEMTKRGLTVAFYYQPKQDTLDRLAAIARSA